MTASLSRFEMVRALVRQGVPKARAEKMIGVTESDVPEITLPVTFTLPWSTLISDNRKYRLGGGSTPRLVLDPDYKKAKQRVAEIAREAVGQVRPTSAPVVLTARVYVPDNRMHDCANFRKACTDALESIVFANDKQVYCETWQRAGIDCDAPRAEISVRLL